MAFKIFYNQKNRCPCKNSIQTAHTAQIHVRQLPDAIGGLNRKNFGTFHGFVSLGASFGQQQVMLVPGFSKTLTKILKSCDFSMNENLAIACTHGYIISGKYER